MATDSGGATPGEMESPSNLPAESPQSSDQVVCMLFEGDYHLGVAALVNSIVNGGFSGLFWLGYRGPLPPWLGQLKQTAPNVYRVGEASLSFELIGSGFHFTHYKPDFMSSLFDRGIARRHLWYFDPDITVRCEWSFFEKWVCHGVSLCQEISMGIMPSDHPIRREWEAVARNAGWGEPIRQLDRYYNGGFVGVTHEYRRFLDRWIDANQLATSAGVDPGQLQHGTRVNPFFSTDQDALNIASMYADVPLSTMGPDGMGFVAGGFAMYHTLGGKKPWRKRFVRSALDGLPPWNGDRHFLECVAGPIQPYTPQELKTMQRSAKLGSLIGRFYRRY